MILPFSTQFNDGSPTNFVGKIWSGLMKADKFDFVIEDDYLNECKLRGLIAGVNSPMDELPDMLVPKLHTIRKDEHNRWKVGNKIHMVVNNRSKDQFQFAPVLECKAVQNIRISWHDHGDYKTVGVRISGARYHVVMSEDGSVKTCPRTIIEIAENDGFNDIDDFFAWFSEDFTGKLIHWTDLTY